MQQLIQQTLLLLKDMASSRVDVLASLEDKLYFSRSPFREQKAIEENKVPPSLSEAVLKESPSKPSQQPVVSTSSPLPSTEIPIKQHLPLSSPKPASSPLGKQAVEELIQKTFPTLTFRKEPLSDEMAKKREQLWNQSHLQSSAVILFFDHTPQEIQFLQNLTLAIHHLIMPAVLVSAKELEKESDFETLLSSPILEWMICPPLFEWKMTPLAQYYRQNGASRNHFLGKHPLFLLEPIRHYLHNPDHKKHLWKSLSMHPSS